ncbi:MULTISPECIES: hypothetical protein [unclassified Phyllobacterium]|uniref:hypothetical protein n=1 Tax=unclassified Phyllobacterium TaxID=2638441 RepID=UPI003012C754
MYGKRVSENGKRVSEGSMSNTALSEAKTWADALMDAEWRGRKDRDGPVRYRVSKKTGVPESYLYRLQYKTAEMKDVAGSVYRSLMLAYEELCERNENAADAMREQRQALRKSNEAHQKSA